MYRVKHWLVEVLWRQKLPAFWPAFKRAIVSPATIGLLLIAALAFGGGLQLDKLFQAEKEQLAYEVEFALKEPYDRPEFSVERWLDDANLPNDKASVDVIIFWSSSCLECRALLSAAQDWEESYAELGLSITTVHIPEFNYEADASVISQVVKEWGVSLPVAIDNDYEIAGAFETTVPPTSFFIDSDQQVRHIEFTSKNLAHSERVIQELLSSSNVFHNFDPPPTTPEDDPLQSFLISDDIYTGTDWLGGFAQSDQNVSGEVVDFESIEPEIGQYGLDGRWLVGPESVVSASDNATITVRFVGESVHVLAGADSELSISLDNYGNSNPGEDVVEGIVSVQPDQFYHLVDLDEVDKSGKLTLRVPRGVEIYKFSF